MSDAEEKCPQLYNASCTLAGMVLFANFYNIISIIVARRNESPTAAYTGYSVIFACIFLPIFLGLSIWIMVVCSSNDVSRVRRKENSIQ